MRPTASAQRLACIYLAPVGLLTVKGVTHNSSRFNGGEPSKRRRILWRLVGRYSQHPRPEIRRFLHKNIWVEFARQFRIAQTSGQNRTSVEEEGRNQVRPREIKTWAPCDRILNAHTPQIDYTNARGIRNGTHAKPMGEHK
jgi:hypothetical protein